MWSQNDTVALVLPYIYIDGVCMCMCTLIFTFYLIVLLLTLHSPSTSTLAFHLPYREGNMHEISPKLSFICRFQSVYQNFPLSTFRLLPVVKNWAQKSYNFFHKSAERGSHKMRIMNRKLEMSIKTERRSINNISSYKYIVRKNKMQK